eukprot:gene3638-4172_t
MSCESEQASEGVTPTVCGNRVRCYFKSSSSTFTSATAVYSWGSGSKGKLGHGVEGDTQIIQPKRLDLPYNVTNVSCGTTYSVFACKDAAGPPVFLGCGDNGSAQLIIGNGRQPALENVEQLKCASFDELSAERSVVQLASGTYHNSVLLDDGSIYMWGTANSGQLGSPVWSRLQFNPFLNTRLMELGTVKVACGSTFTVALTKDGNMYSMGSSTFNELGHDSDFTERVPRLIKNKLLTDDVKVTDIASGFFHSVALTNQNRIITWGRNQESQCAPIEGLLKGAQSPITYIDTSMLDANDKIVQIGCGSFSSYILTESGVMYSIGSNEQGQLGVGKDYEKGRLNRIPLECIKKFWTAHKEVSLKRQLYWTVSLHSMA